MQGIGWSSLRSRLTVAAGIAALFVGIGTMVTAQNQSRWDRTQQPMQGGEYTRAGELIGTQVYDRNGERIGTFQDFVLDQNHERVLYAVISEGNWMGRGENHAVPWQMVQVSPDQDRVTLPIDQQKFENSPSIGTDYPNPQLDQTAERWTSVQQWEQNPAPSADNQRDRRDQRDRDRDDDGNIFERQRDRTNRGNQADRDEDGNIFERRQDRRSPQADRSTARNTYKYEEGMRKGSDLLGMNVQFNASGDMTQRGRTRGSSAEARGSIDDMLIHRDGSVHIAIVEPNSDFMDIGADEFIAVPWSHFNFQPEQEMAFADLSYDEAASLVIEEDNLDRFDDPNFRNRFFSDAGIIQPFAQRGTQGRTWAGTGNQAVFDKWSDFASQCLGRNLNRQDQEIDGRILSVGTLQTNPDSEAPNGRSFTVETPNNRDMRVYIGPNELIPNELALNQGTQVTVRGTECEIDNRDVMVANEIQFDGRTFTLVERDGVPHWTPESQQQRGTWRR